MKKSFAKELAELINRHSIDAELNTPDWILANLVIDGLKTYDRTTRLVEKSKADPEPEKDDCDCPACQMRRALEAKTKSFVVGGRIHEKELERLLNLQRKYRKPEAFDVPKEVGAMAEFFNDMFPGSKVEIHRVEMPRRNPRDKRRGKNKRNGKGGNK